MALQQDNSIDTSNTACRIVVVAPSITQATSFISRIQLLQNASAKLELQDETTGYHDILSPSLVKVPWTIENKYYSADVHFAAHPMRGLAPYLVQNVSAVIFAWGDTEAYKHHIERLSRDLNGYEPEVALAVRFKTEETPSEAIDEEDKNDDNSTIDGFLSNYGFEYVDATQESLGKRTLDYGMAENEGTSDGIPGFPRVLDALSTIMWPSMRPRERSANQGQGKARRDPTLVEWEAGGSQDNETVTLLDDLMANKNIPLSARAERMQSEMEELTRWLTNEETPKDLEDPWRLAVSSEAVVSSANDGEFARNRSEEMRDGANPTPKFDDDFTLFISAPAVAVTESSQLTPVEVGDHNMLNTSSWGSTLYNSLQSVSDFGGSEGDLEAKMTTANDDDDGLPTEEEILETSSKIFGKERDAEGSEHDVMFDISKVLSALQHMKEDIAGMDNEDERRQAAARVALGLVYGLEELN